ncbi:MAG TPA: zf-HC2 domain-containing protein [Gemmatimonadaceae bacterium]|jgi:anti-sigma factor RsiW|nr:zf-HC2 domain-containing protein [Gemmatimonadaceae bacterium]
MTSPNMTCDEFDTALPDYLEGTLDDSRRAAVEGHLSECVRCASMLRDIENIQKEAAAMPDMAPSRDLWQGIEARIAAPVIPLAARPVHQRRLAPAWMGVAAAALIASTAGITYMLTANSLRPAPNVVAQVTPPTSPAPSNNGTETRVPVGPTSPSATDIGGAGAQPNLTPSLRPRPDVPSRQGGIPAQLATQITSDRAHSDLVYGREIEMLQNIVSRRRVQLDSSTVAIIERNLRIIDAAIAQSRAALAEDPASRMLDEQLTHSLDKKVELLRTAAMLPAST